MICSAALISSHSLYAEDTPAIECVDWVSHFLTVRLSVVDVIHLSNFDLHTALTFNRMFVNVNV